ncbi:prepilin-type N-terminal cleavage/methylation domain-containing protein [Chitinilyticum litopenaei]|uniref:prepilin-type N-terminal cleavage/methylation domain-containing protein n=1 Tax=Chitinilyticum litopenaei TaxID=1121276 RepID=UPI0009DB7CDB|nr:prepilin-type N-terminal cleavage/methylation domain-containing protein [Chitinilyticum litopenaei]
MKTPLHPNGFTLIELMVAVAMGMLVLMALGTMLSDQIRSSQDTRRAIALNQDMREAMDLVVSDLRRAGYFAGSASAPTAASPYYNISGFNGKALNTGTISPQSLTRNSNTSSAATSNTNCILYGYDRDNDHLNPGTAAADKNRFGFALRNGVLMIHRGGNSAHNCTADNSTGTGLSSEWEALTDPTRMTITSLHFVVSSSISPSPAVAGNPVICSWQVQISMMAEHPRAPSVQKNMIETVKLRNSQRKNAPSSSTAASCS